VDLVGIAVQPFPSLNTQEAVRATNWPKATAGPYALHMPLFIHANGVDRQFAQIHSGSVNMR